MLLHGNSFCYMFGAMNWPKVITDLELAGMTQTEIATECDCSQPYVSQLKSGLRKDPAFSVGAELAALHKRRCGSGVRQKAAS